MMLFVISPGIAKSADLNAMIQQKLNEANQMIKANGMNWQNKQAQAFSQMRNKLDIPKQPQEGVIVFVSFSMPKASLQQLLVEARRYHVPVVVRGLVNNSFQQTKATLDSILKKGKLALNGSVQLNPMWFRQFNITQVPAFVAYKRAENCPLGKACNDARFDVLTGNISLDQALTILRDKAKDTSAFIAGKYLNQPMDLIQWTNIKSH